MLTHQIEVITYVQNEDSKNRLKTIYTDCSSQIAEKLEIIVSLNTEIASIITNINTLKVNLKVKKTAPIITHLFVVSSRQRSYGRIRCKNNLSLIVLFGTWLSCLKFENKGFVKNIEIDGETMMNSLKVI